jgi:hypothetical protein
MRARVRLVTCRVATESTGLAGMASQMPGAQAVCD